MSAARGPVLAAVAGDGGETDRALAETACAVARTLGAPRVELFSTIEIPSGLRRADAEALLQAERDSRAARLHALAEALPGPCVAEVALAEGRGYRALVRRADTIGAHLALKAADPSPRPPVALFASVDQHLLRKCPCPIWLLRPPVVPPARVLAAVDLPEPDDAAEAPDAEAEGLNAAILETAQAIASAAPDAPGGPAVQVVHAWEDPLEGLARGWSGDGAQAAQARAASAAHAAESARKAALEGLVERARLAWAASGAAPVRLVPHLLAGNPRRALPKAVAEMGAGLLVMGTLARGGVPGLLIGNTAEDVLNAVDCDVAAVKPPGWVSPLLR
jgi:nucleotide-binding universal stress UspA family protein